MLKLNTTLILTATFFFFSLPSLAASEYIKENIKDAKIVGEGKFSFFIWDIYNGQLYAPGGRYDKAKPLALRLEYLRDFNGKEIADRSISEMRKQGYKDIQSLRKWRQQMENIFPNVSDGDVITGIYKNGSSKFYYNGENIGEIKDHKFSEKFFDIWLSEKTSEPRFRKKLLGSI